MKYRVDIVLTGKGDNFEQKFIEKDFDDSFDAHEERERICNNVPEGFYVSWNKVYPVVICECGEEVPCGSFTNECECGCDYNFAGQLLADRSQWGEETGESWQECY
jgi:hypothetical protein